MDEVMADQAPIDVERCIDLHNQIVALIVERLAPRQVAIQKNWFTIWGDRAEAVREGLTDEVIQFLEGINLFSPDIIYFTPHILSVADPTELFGGGLVFGQDEYDNCVVLYQSFDLDSHGRGLVLDMDNHLACFSEHIWDNPPPVSSWVCLEDILEMWLDMIQKKRFIIVDNEWKMVEYIAADVDDAVEMWNDYLDTIVKNLPQAGSQTLSNSQRNEISQPHNESSNTKEDAIGWVSKEALDEWQIEGFAREFLLRARAPPFKYVAPGLYTLSDFALRDIGPLFCEQRKDKCYMDGDIPPLLLFPSDANLKDTSETLFLGNRAGLYVMPSFSWIKFGDLVDLYTPWQDREIYKYANFTVPDDKCSPLIELCPFMPGSHNVRLWSVLNHWKGLVEKGFWTVGADGVQGGIEAWKMADECPEEFRLNHICLC